MSISNMTLNQEHIHKAFMGLWCFEGRMQEKGLKGKKARELAKQGLAIIRQCEEIMEKENLI